MRPPAAGCVKFHHFLGKEVRRGEVAGGFPIFLFLFFRTKSAKSAKAPDGASDGGAEKTPGEREEFEGARGGVGGGGGRGEEAGGSERRTSEGGKAKEKRSSGSTHWAPLKDSLQGVERHVEPLDPAGALRLLVRRLHLPPRGTLGNGAPGRRRRHLLLLLSIS